MVDVEGMTTREDTDFSITVRTGEADGVVKYRNKLVSFFDENCEKYAIGVEYAGGDIESQHYQCACVFKLSRRADNLKTTLVSLLKHDGWEPKHVRNAICVKKHHDVLTLAGGYCRKEDTDALFKGWTREELDEASQKYLILKDASDKRNISQQKIIEIIKNFNESYEHHKNPDIREKWANTGCRAKLHQLYSQCITEGYDMAKFYNPNKFNYFLNFFNVLFCSAEFSPEQFLRV